jgi:hypothetical protein
MKNMGKDPRTHDLYGEDDITKSKFLEIELYMESHAKEIVDFIELRIKEKSHKDIKITGKITDRIINQLVNKMPFGPTFDMTHIVLADALVSSLWCGWLSQSMVNRKEPKFNDQYVEQFGRAITKAYDIGCRYANRQELDENKEPPTTENE